MKDDAWPFAAIITGIVAAAAAVIIPFAYMFLLEEYQQRRVTIFLDPEADPLGEWLDSIARLRTLDEGLLVNLVGGTTIRLAPPLTVTRTEVRAALDTFRGGVYQAVEETVPEAAVA